jgi:enamine deaminase RidA (YjgF/YER057c/UK114 family)
MSVIAQKLADRGITLPKAPAPVAAYVPFVIADRLVFIAGQLPVEDGQVKFTGILGATIDLASGQKAARLCALNILAHLHMATDGDLDRVERCVRLGGFIASTPDFADQPQVLNAASELMQDIFGAAGQHARAAVGVSALPRHACVEIEAIFSLRA